jgi:four helix bundle protein
LWQTWRQLKQTRFAIDLYHNKWAARIRSVQTCEEGYGRLSRVEYVRFLDIARGSARETRGRYERMKHWLAEDVIQQRMKLLDEIIGILTASIGTMRKK